MAELENIGIYWVALNCIGMDELGSVDSLGVEHNIQIKRHSVSLCTGCQSRKVTNCYMSKQHSSLGIIHTI